jgi:hypothetical protein
MAEYFNRYVVSNILPSLYLHVISDMLTSKLVYWLPRFKSLADINPQRYMANHTLQLPKTRGGYLKIEVGAPFTAVASQSLRLCFVGIVALVNDSLVGMSG